jgi:tetratricopeptide (TPR) repeat protein
VTAVRAAVLLLLYAASAHAQTEDQLKRARAHFEAGRALYHAGSYNDAIQQWLAGYEAVPLPNFLLNLGQAYRRIGALPRAREMYRRFLDEAPPDAPERATVTRLLGEIERLLVESQPSPEPTPEPTVAPSPTPQAMPLVAATPTETKQPHFLRRHWWIFPAAAIVIVGVTLASYYGTRSDSVSCSDPEVVGCLMVP